MLHRPIESAGKATTLFYAVEQNRIPVLQCEVLIETPFRFMNTIVRHRGLITNWKDDHGFGFITPSDGGDTVFVHISAFPNRNRRPKGNETVTYQMMTDAQGRAQASRVRFAGDQKGQSTTTTRPVVYVFASSHS